MVIANKRRAVLEVPGNVPKMLAKAGALKVDVLMFDLEDSVPAAAKDKAVARKLIAQVLEEKSYNSTEISVRINPTDSIHFFDDVFWLKKKQCDSVFLPKVRSSREYFFVEELFDKIGISQDVKIVLIVETPGALLDLTEIAKSARRLNGLVAGGFDYTLECGSNALNAIAGIGGELEKGHLIQMRQTVVAVARAYGLSAIDGLLVARPKDSDALRLAASDARKTGFNGCIVFYPPMVDVVMEVFQPTGAEVEWAQKVIGLHAQSVAEGRAAFQMEGVAILPHHVTVAQQIIDLSSA
jgi:citrate lyase beta subunit